MNLADLDRPPIAWRYDRWNRDVTFRKLSAGQLVELSAASADDEEIKSLSPKGLAFYAKLLELCVVDPHFDADTWMTEATTETLMELGQQALDVNGLGAAAKKN